MSESDHHAMDHHRLEAATESAWAKVLSRFGTPTLLGMLAWFGNQAFDDIRQSQKEQATASALQATQIQDVRADVKLLNAKVDYSVLQQMAALDRRVQLLEDQNKVLRAAR
jgi:hypothetical protein